MDMAEAATGDVAVILMQNRPGRSWAIEALKVLTDRTFALLLGVGVGAMIGLGFVQHAAAPAARPVAAEPARPPALPHQTAATVAPADAALPFQPHLVSALAAGQPVTVGVFGDSFGDGVWAALYRRLPKSGSYKVVKYSEAATGFVRNHDMAQDALAKVGDQPLDIAVIDFGANDALGLTDAGKGYALMSSGWRRIYGQRVDALVAALRSKGAMVYWVGLPKMRSPEYDQHMTQMNAFYAERMAALGVPFLSTIDRSVDETGQFNAYLADGPAGEKRLMRAGDGVHMSMAGYERISAPLAERIKAYVARAAAAARLETAQAAPAPATTDKDPG